MWRPVFEEFPYRLGDFGLYFREDYVIIKDKRAIGLLERRSPFSEKQGDSPGRKPTA